MIPVRFPPAGPGTVRGPPSAHGAGPGDWIGSQQNNDISSWFDADRVSKIALSTKSGPSLASNRVQCEGTRPPHKTDVSIQQGTEVIRS